MTKQGLSGQEIVQRLMKLQVSKWRIARELGVSWKTVFAWSKGYFKPAEKRQEFLRVFLEAVESGKVDQT